MTARRLISLAGQVIVALLLLLLLLISSGAAAVKHSANFTISTNADQAAADAYAAICEHYRRHQAEAWLGAELPRWTRRATIQIKHDDTSGGGYTTFQFAQGQVIAIGGKWQGSHDKLARDVIPHEVMHTVLASHFGRPLPRWIDEGICCTNESPESQDRLRRICFAALTSRPSRAFPTSRILDLMQYPQDVRTFYAQGHSLADYLLNTRGRRGMVNLIARRLNTARWEFTAATLQNDWLAWMRAGRPAGQVKPIDPPAIQWKPAAGTTPAHWHHAACF